MTPRVRKVALIAASLGLLVSLFLALRPNDDDTATTTVSTPTTVPATTTAPATTAPAATTTPTTTAEPPPTTAPPPRPTSIRIVVEGGTPVGGIRRATVKKGVSVVLMVVADVSDEIHLHGYDLKVDVAPGEPARIAFEATVAGRFEVELEDRGVLVAVLNVRP